MYNSTITGFANDFVQGQWINAEKKWMELFEGRNHMITLMWVGFVMHEVVYFGRFIPFWICDFLPFMQKWKIQEKKQNTWDLYMKCLKTLLFNHLLVQLPMMIFFHPLAEMFGMDIVAPFPPISEVLQQTLIFMVFEDFFHYWAHRGLHYGWWYKAIHKKHHEYQAPFGIAAEYAHPLETLILGFGTVGGPLIWVAITHRLHIITMLFWICVRLVQTIDAHSGYDFPWSLRRWLPFWAGSDYHDFHHMNFIGNYSTSFRWWDVAMGTDKSYKLWKAKKSDYVAPKEE